MTDPFAPSLTKYLQSFAPPEPEQFPTNMTGDTWWAWRVRQAVSGAIEPDSSYWNIVWLNLFNRWCAEAAAHWGSERQRVINDLMKPVEAILWPERAKRKGQRN